MKCQIQVPCLERRAEVDFKRNRKPKTKEETMDKTITVLPMKD